MEALSLMARRAPGQVMLLREIAAACHLPPGFLAKIFQKLARHNLVASHRGAVRGYALARPPHKITLTEIFEAIEGPSLFERCIFWSEQCGDPNPCRLHERWAKLRPQLQAMMAETTLDQVSSGRAPASKRKPDSATPRTREASGRARGAGGSSRSGTDARGRFGRTLWN